MKTPKDSAEETVTKPSTKSEKSEVKEETTAKKKSGKKLPESKSKKGAKKVKKSKKSGKVLKFEPKDNRILGKWRPNQDKGKLAAKLIAEKSITVPAAMKFLGLKGDKGHKKVVGMLYRIRRFGKRSGYLSCFPSQKPEGKAAEKWILKMLKPAPKVKMDKVEKKAHKKAA